MKCMHCQRPAQMFENDIDNMIEVSNDRDSTMEGSLWSEKAEDIGGFAELAGCLDRLKSSEKQVIFVFTNQIDWKFMPVECAVRSTSQQLATESGHIKEERKVPSSLLLSKNSPESSQNFTRIIATFNKRFTKLLRTSPDGIRAQRKMTMFSNSQSTLKWTHAVSNAADDDFV